MSNTDTLGTQKSLTGTFEEACEKKLSTKDKFIIAAAIITAPITIPVACAAMWYIHKNLPSGAGGSGGY
jgi:hypothetical protein